MLSNPALVQWEGGELFAFAEGRKSNCADFGNVDILMRRSVDSGKTWSPARVLVDNGDLQAGNSTPIIDRLDPRFSEGRLLLFYNTGTATEYDTRMGLGKRRGYVIASSDHGEHWSAPQEIVPENPDLDQRTWAFAPGHGMQFNQGPYAGRLFVPANRSVGGPQAIDLVILSRRAGMEGRARTLSGFLCLFRYGLLWRPRTLSLLRAQ